MFLDVKMPELDGFDVIVALDASSTPLIVFVTAYDEHALRAFETMKEMEQRLGDRFVRIHRCHAVNVARIAELRAAAAVSRRSCWTTGPPERGHSFQERLEQCLKRA